MNLEQETSGVNEIQKDEGDNDETLRGRLTSWLLGRSVACFLILLQSYS
jgi:hypothetical protein